MFTSYTVAAAAILGAAVGAAAARTLKGQGTPKAYIVTEVDGVSTSYPSIVAKARKLDRITDEEMLEIAATGGRVLQLRQPVRALARGGSDARLHELRRRGRLVLRVEAGRGQQVLRCKRPSRDRHIG